MKKKLLCLIVLAALLMSVAAAAELTIASGTVGIASNQYWCNTSATSVTIPSGVRSIGSFAFYGCSNLTKVSIPNTVTQIDGSAFRGCSSLTSVIIPSSVTSIGSYAFYGCSLLTDVTIAGGVTSIGNGAFGACGSLKSISIPASVTSIGNAVFASDAKPTITCTQGSYADKWAKTYGYPRSYAGAPSVSVEGNLTVCVGGTGKIVPKVFPAGYTVSYSSSNTAVAKVASDGKVTGIAAGHATVTVKAGSTQKTVDVQVVTPVSTFTLSESELLMAKGRSKDIETVELLPMQAYPELTASSSNIKVVTVSGNTITAVGAGDAIVTFSSINSVKQTVQVHVVDTAYPTAEFAGPATRTIPVGLTVVTGDSVTAITLASEGVVPVTTWTSGYTDSEGVRVWNLKYAFGKAGSRKLYILTSDGGKIPVSVQVNDLVRTKVMEAVFEDNPCAGVPANLTVKTSVYAKYLQMYSGSTLLKTWNTGYADKDGIRTWTLNYTFAGPA